VISAYAAGVVVGAPAIAAFAGRLPRKTLLLACLIVFAIGSVASALAPNFGLLVLFRFLAAIPHGAYFGVASLVAGDLLGPGRRARGVALVLGGLTVANVIGVPAITYLGQLAGWRAAYIAVAAVFVVVVAFVWLTVRFEPGDPTSTIRRELGGFTKAGIWITLAGGAIGVGGFFAVQSYVAPLTTQVTGLAAGWVPIVLIAGGLGMTVGNFLGGHFADRHTTRTIFVGFGVFAASLVLMAFVSHTPVGLFVGIFLVLGSGSVLSPAIQTRLMEVAGESQVFAAATHHAAMNLGNSLGAYLGGAVIAAGLGYVAPSWVGVILCVPGVLLSVLAWRLTRTAPDHFAGGHAIIA
jgi:DHA1 family inner membrane transport protein